ncbi:MAG: hypothetical protein WC728_06170 [Elusimicrobiota bacterium]
MKIARIAVVLCAAVLPLSGTLLAQDYMGESDSASRKSDSPKPEKKAKKMIQDDAVEPGQKTDGDRKNINAYLKVRLKQLEDSHRAQEIFGRRMSKAWDDFWTRCYNSRKDFDVSIARNRLNHMQTLATLDPEYHKQMTSKFEDLQSVQLQSFEKSQKKDLAEFFTQLQNDVKAFQAEQDKWLTSFMTEATQAWLEQKQDSKAQ